VTKLAQTKFSQLLPGRPAPALAAVR